MAEDPVKGLQGYVSSVNCVKDPYAVNVVIEILPYFVIYYLA